MNCIAVARDDPCPRIAALHFGNRLILGHALRHRKIHTIAASVGAVLRLGQALRDQCILVGLSAKPTCRR